MTPEKWTDVGNSYQRPLGHSEFAFLPASQTGLGDMFLHIAFRAPTIFMRRSRVATAWAVIRARHPLLMSTIIVDGEDMGSARFSFTPPEHVDDTLAQAEAALAFKYESKDELISNYLNGPRTLANDRLSYLVVSTLRGSNEVSGEEEYDLLMCAPHFAGDGTSLHQSAHELLGLVASPASDSQLLQELLSPPIWKDLLPPAFETRLPAPANRLAKAAAQVNYIQTLEKEIGGQTLSRLQRGPQKTVLLERAFTEAQTTSILTRCKSNGVTINHALSALCNVAWGRCISDSQASRDPMMMYTAINLRSKLSPHPTCTHWFLALTYFNIVLPAFLPASPAVFWHRARLAKAQTHRAVQSRFLSSRALEMASARASRVRGDPPNTVSSLRPSPSVAPAAPSLALMGLSLIGNLDATYIRTSYPSVHLHSVSTASRQKAGGLLLLAHTFGKKLWLQMYWDSNGFAEGHVERFWEGLQGSVEDFVM